MLRNPLARLRALPRRTVLAAAMAAALLAILYGGLVYRAFILYPERLEADDRAYALDEALGLHAERLSLRKCRWWALEYCLPLALPPDVLTERKKLERAVDAVLHPCRYDEAPDSFEHTPVLLFFPGLGVKRFAFGSRTP